jgi:hypothetical protein
VLVALDLALFGQAVASGRMIGLDYTDGAKVIYFWRLFYRESILSGHFPVWLPNVLMGFPFVGEPLTGSFYPLAPLFLVMSVERAASVFFAVHLAVAGVGMYALARRFGLRRAPALLAGTVFMLNGHFAGYVFGGLQAEVASLAWMPLALFVFDCAIGASDRRHRAIWTLLLAVILALEVLAGHPQRALFSGFVLGCYALWIAAGRRREGARALTPVALLIGASVLGLLIAAAQVLPAWEMLRLSGRAPHPVSGLSLDRETFAGSLFPVRLVTLAVPDLFGDAVSLAPVRTDWLSAAMDDVHTLELQAYVGIVPLVLALFAMKRNGVRAARFFVLLVAAAVVLALGRYALVYPLLYWIAPPLRTFRIPARFLAVVVFGLSFLAGCGLQALMTEHEPAFLRSYRRWGTSLAIAAGLLAAGAAIAFALSGVMVPQGLRLMRYLYDVKQRGHRLPLTVWLDVVPVAFRLAVVSILKAAALLAAAAWLFIRVARGQAPAKLIAVVILSVSAVDVWWFAHRHLKTTSIGSAMRSNEAVLAAAGPATMSYRMYSFYGPADERLDPLLAPSDDAVIAAGRFSLVGYEPAELASFGAVHAAVDRQLERHTSSLLDMLNVKWVMTRTMLASPALHAFDTGAIRVYENRAALPRSWMCFGATVVASQDAALASLEDGAVDPHERVAIVGPVPAGLTVDHAPPCRPLAASMPDAASYEIHVETDRPAMVVLSDIYFPGWTASIGSRPVPVMRVDYLLKGVVVSAGVSDVRLRYEPRSVRLGALVSLASLAGVGILLATAIGTRGR